VTYHGEHVTIDDVTFVPTPVQRPRVPIWVGGMWPNKPPMRRAARWDGAIPATAGVVDAKPPSLEETEELVRFLRTQLRSYGREAEPFDIVLGGASPSSPSAARNLIGPLADRGVTWWDERLPWGDEMSRVEPILRRVDQGPPRL
jgi:alkanesulfonate monooxygenase SsuD/methylene tetrahydromethanopterin reductase-like flavin-dependent oxidoreductase (luciferase family)